LLILGKNLNTIANANSADCNQRFGYRRSGYLTAYFRRGLNENANRQIVNNPNRKNPNHEKGVSREGIVGTLELDFPLLDGFCDRFAEPKRTSLSSSSP
jgi:hypothetical protein